MTSWFQERWTLNLPSPKVLENIALHAGFKPEDFDLRGEVISLYHNDSNIYVVALDAAAPKLAFWWALCNKYIGVDSYGFTYTVMEAENCRFDTNDMGLLGTYYWNNFGDDKFIDKLIHENFFSTSRAETRENLLILFPTMDPDTPFEELLEKFEEKYSDICTINEWTPSEIYDFIGGAAYV